MNIRKRVTRLITLAAAVTLAFTGGLAAPAQAAESSSYIANDTVWTDTSGKEILAQGGNVLKVGSTYYWVGQKLVSGTPKAVNLYSSTDLENWTFKGPILEQSGTEGALAVGKWLGRPQLNYNPTTRKFVLIVEVNDQMVYVGKKPTGEDEYWGRNGILFATSDTVDGTYTPTSTQSAKVNGRTTGDRSVFVDGDKAYLVYVADKGGRSINNMINLAPLNKDWTAVEPTVYWEDEPHKEAPAILKANGKYYLFASGKRDWDATATYYRVSDTLGGWNTQEPWKKVPHRPTRDDGGDNSFGTQFEQIIPVVGESGTTSYLFNGDRYSQYYGGTSAAPGGIGRNAWYPLTFEGTAPVLHGWSDVDVDTKAGTITGNRVANGRFDQDIAGKKVPHWTVKAGSNTYTQKIEDNPAVKTHEIPRQLTVESGWISQDVALPNGSYELSFDYRSSGAQKNAYFEVKGHDGQRSEKVHLNTARNQWATQKIPFTVKSGKATLGVWVDSAAPAWLNIDNVSVWSAS
ncbi:family 43 glycosylhydrolase [Streptomyces cyaneofuscatus]|uniref:family 43 glycosylhydrolase n=1 Tax=Streptomyces cyaneofuscatus TaxID=66883 RepID=UPI003676F8C2